MIIGVPKEIKDSEARVSVIPAGVKMLTDAGHKVLVETNAGAQSAFPDEDYQDAGAEIVGDAGYVWGKSDTVVKVKDPSDQAVQIAPHERNKAAHADPASASRCTSGTASTS